MTSNLFTFLDRSERIKKITVTQCKKYANAQKCAWCKKLTPERYRFCLEHTIE